MSKVKREYKKIKAEVIGSKKHEKEMRDREEGQPKRGASSATDDPKHWLRLEEARIQRPVDRVAELEAAVAQPTHLNSANDESEELKPTEREAEDSKPRDPSQPSRSNTQRIQPPQSKDKPSSSATTKFTARPDKTKQGKKPDYFDKQLHEAAQRKAAQEAKTQEIQRRKEERVRKVAERDLLRRQMNKAMALDSKGQRKIGRESQVLFEQVKRMMRDKPEPKPL
jgi:hypothetical protein